MADLVPTAANVHKYAGATVVTDKIAGATITAGMPLYYDAAAGKMLKAANTGIPTAKVAGVSVNAAVDGQEVAYVSAGEMDLGCTLTVGETYVLSAAGLISPIGDAAASDYMTILGIAKAADKIVIKINISDTAHA